MPRTSSSKKAEQRKNDVQNDQKGAAEKKQGESMDAERLLHIVENRALEDIYYLYFDPSKVKKEGPGLAKMADKLQLKNVLCPRQKATVMIVGTHSAGKSTFVNWFTGRKSLKTSMGIETDGFSIVTQGAAESVTEGETAVTMFQYVQRIASHMNEAEKAGFTKRLRCYTLPPLAKQQRSFPDVDLIDTPGTIRDSDYGFDLRKSILDFAEFVDLILVFMEPTNKLTEGLLRETVASLNNHGFARKMRYCLTKTDTLNSKAEISQVLQNVMKELGPLLKEDHSTSVKTIWIPEAAKRNSTGEGAEDYAENAMSEILTEIEERVKAKVQNNMDTVTKHTGLVLEAIPTQREVLQRKMKDKMKLMLYGASMWPLLVFPVLIAYLELMTYTGLLDKLKAFSALPDSVLEFRANTLTPFFSFLPHGDEDGLYSLAVKFMLLVMGFLLVALISEVFAFRRRRLGRVSKADLRELQEWEKDVRDYEEYADKELRQCISNVRRGDEFTTRTSQVTTRMRNAATAEKQSIAFMFGQQLPAPHGS